MRLRGDGRLLWVAPSCRAVLGMSAEAVLARGLDLMPPEAAALRIALGTLVPGGMPARLELAWRRADGGIALLAATLHAVGARGFLAFARDITRERRLESLLAETQRRLDRLDFEDRLTRLGNRARLLAAIPAARLRAARLDRSLALVVVRVVGFGDFVDRYGTIAADDSLCRIARTLAGTIRRPADLAVRTGAARFCLLLPDTDRQGAEVAARRVVAAIAALGIDHTASPRGVVEVRARVFMLYRQSGKRVSERSAYSAVG